MHISLNGRCCNVKVGKMLNCFHRIRRLSGNPLMINGNSGCCYNVICDDNHSTSFSYAFPALPVRLQSFQCVRNLGTPEER